MEFSRLNFNGLDIMYNIAKSLSCDDDLHTIMEDILRTLHKHADMCRGTISIFNFDKSEVIVDVVHGIKGQRKKYKTGEGITGKVAETGKTIIIEDINNNSSFLGKYDKDIFNTEYKTFMCVPIKLGNNVIGTLSVYINPQKSKSNLKEEKRFLEAISDLIARMVHQKRVHNEYVLTLEKENLELRKTLEEMGRPEKMIGNSSLMRKIFREIAQVAPSPTTVMIRGETGTGKELVARAIHQKSLFKDGPFVAVNCAALPESLIESVLFGHEKGAFTGAVSKQIGQFEAANNGTLFLDEIGEMPLSAQGRLLRAIQEKEFQRVGGTENIRVNVRLITATNRNLEKDVEEGRFREDLYYRINVFSITLPPLRERGADILLLADYFVKKYSEASGKNINRISTTAIDMLSSYHWPGNVRELENVIERAVLVAHGDSIEGHDLPPTLQIKNENLRGTRKASFEDMVKNYEMELIIEALKDAHGNQSKAAELLNTTKRVIQYKIKQYNIDYKRYK